MTQLTATVKYPAGKICDTKQGQRMNAVLTLPSGEEYKHWADADDPWVKSWKKGDTVPLQWKGNTLEVAPPAPSAPHSSPTPNTQPPTPNKNWTDEHRQLVFQEIHRRAKVLAACHAQISEQFSDGEGGSLVSEETIQKYATTLFIDVCKLWQ